MIDSHNHPENWGIKPYLLEIGKFRLGSYEVFVSLGIIVGFIVYKHLSAQDKKMSDNSFIVLIAAFIGGVLGAKLPIWIMHFREIVQALPDIRPILAGRTITGGLVGGTLAVIFTKRKLGIKEKKGNFFAPAIAIGVAIGRVGCLLRGCCYGHETCLPWGIELGDGVMRHPTQIYEIIFMLIMFAVLMKLRKKAKPGFLFYLLMTSYFSFRFIEEYLRESVYYYGFTLFQYISVGALLFINVKYILEKKRRECVKENE